MASGGDSAGYDDAFVVKYDSDGQLQWIKQSESSGSNCANGITVAGSGHGFYIVGQMDGSLLDGGGAARKGNAFVQHICDDLR